MSPIWRLQLSLNFYRRDDDLVLAQGESEPCASFALLLAAGQPPFGVTCRDILVCNLRGSSSLQSSPKYLSVRRVICSGALVYRPMLVGILAEGAIARSMTPCGDVLFAS